MLTVLRNGLSVFVEENHAAPVVALQVWVKVGSADERPDELGLAHLHEHMLFKGTQRRGPGEVARAIEAAGGEINAWTSFDQTVYHATLGSRFWRTGLDVLADATTAAAFDPEELQREIEVVCEEIKRSADSPSRRVGQELFALAYTQHPYGRPVIGSEASVRAHTREGILRFYRRWYRPEQMLLVAVGDLREEELLAEAAARFTWPSQVGVPALEAPPSLLPSPRRPEEPRRYAPRARLMREPIREAHLSLAWPAPSLHHDDVAALDVLALALGNGEASRLFRALKRERLLVNDVHASCYTPRDPGLTVVSLQLQPETVREAVARATREVHRLRTEELADEELDVACRLLESDTVYQRETVQGQARKLGFYLSATGSLAAEEKYYGRLAALTPQLVREAAERWLDPRALCASALLPEAGGPLDEAGLCALLEESCAEALRAPPPRPRPQLSRPPPVRPALRLSAGRTGELLRERLPGGTTLLVREERSVPLVSLRAAWPGGLRVETPEDTGLHLFLARLVAKGTQGRSAEQIARAMESMGGSLSGISGRNSFGLRAEVLSRFLPEAFDLFADAIDRPAFVEAEVERERTLQLEELRARDDNPAGVAFQLFGQTLWQHHPYRFDVLGTAESVARFTPESLERVRTHRYAAPGAVIAVVGDVDPADVISRVRARLASTAPPAAPPCPDEEPAVTAPRAAVRVLDKAQAHLVLGFPGTRMGAPDQAALEVLANVLAGQGGRLFLELRDKRSLAYSVTAFSTPGVDPGSFALYIGCSPSKVALALEQLRAEVQRLLDSPPGEDELDRARTHLIGSNAIGLQRNAARAALVAFDECYGLGTDFSARYEERIGAVTREGLLAAARATLRPSAEVVALVAPRAACPEELWERAAPTAPKA